MKKIDLCECHKLLLGIAKEFDKICTKHNIPYYMLGGTMLGAIRHKGFIPWDDDMDFGVPRQYYAKLIPLLDKELPERYKCYTYLNNKAVKSPFVKIADTRTRINDPRIDLPIEEQIGLNIDIFPLDYCEPNNKKINKIYRIERFRQIVYINPPVKSFFKSFVKSCLRLICPLSNKSLIEKSIGIASNLEYGKYLGNIFGRWKIKEIVPSEWYGISVRYQFEDIKLCGIKEYDKYLKHLYKDYMELPPEGNRFCHTSEMYYYE